MRKKLTLIIALSLALINISVFADYEQESWEIFGLIGSTHNVSRLIDVDNGEEEPLFEKIVDEVSKRFPTVRKLKRKKSGFTLYAVGDIMFHTSQLNAAKRTGTYDFTEVFAELNPIIDKGISIANFETTVGDKKFSGYPRFRVPSCALTAIKKAGFDILALANNHSADGGLDGVIRTKKAVKNEKMIPIGTFTDEDKSTNPKIVKINGERVALLNYTYGLNGLDGLLKNKRHFVNKLDKAKILSDIQYAKERAKGIIAVVHWGTEYRTSPSQNQLMWANFLAENGVDIILGSHPHVIEPAGFIEKNGHRTYCIFSMGNFVSNQRRAVMKGSPLGEDGVIVELKVKFDEERLRVDDVKYHTTWVNKTRNPLKFVILPIDRALAGEIAGITAHDKKMLEQSKQRTMKILANEYKFQN